MKSILKYVLMRQLSGLLNLTDILAPKLETQLMPAVCYKCSRKNNNCECAKRTQTILLLINPAFSHGAKRLSSWIDELHEGLAGSFWRCEVLGGLIYF